MKIGTPAGKSNDANNKKILSNLGEYLNRHVAMPNGFKLVVRKSRKVSCGFYFEVKCARGRAASHGSGSKSNTHTRLSQTEDEVCCFFLPVYYDTKVNLFFVKQHCYPMFQHDGHSKVDRNHMKNGKSVIPEETREIAEGLLGKHCSPAVVQLLLNVMHGDKITSDSIAKMRSAVHISKFRGKQDESAADTLLNILKNEDGLTYCYITGSYDEAMERVRVRKGMLLKEYYMLWYI